MSKNQVDQSGLTAIGLLLIILLIFGGLFGGLFGYSWYLEECGDAPIGVCVDQITKGDEAVEETASGEQTVVTATGSFSVKSYGVTLALTFPLEGGAVTGNVSGNCSGNVTGNYEGEETGVISGKVFGSCDPFFVPVPGKATFSGNVNQQSSIVSISGSGSAAGFSGSGSMTLNY
jgi:hypothetical protein